MENTINITELIRNNIELLITTDEICKLARELRTRRLWNRVETAYQYMGDDFTEFTAKLNSVQAVLGEGTHILSMKMRDVISVIYIKSIGDKMSEAEYLAFLNDVNYIFNMTVHITRVYDEYYPGAKLQDMSVKTMLILYFSAVRLHYTRLLGIPVHISDYVYNIITSKISKLNGEDCADQHRNIMGNLNQLANNMVLDKFTMKAGRKNVHIGAHYVTCFSELLGRISEVVHIIVTEYNNVDDPQYPTHIYLTGEKFISVSDAYDYHIRNGIKHNKELFHKDMYRLLMDAMLYLYIQACKSDNGELVFNDTMWTDILTQYDIDNNRK